MTDPVFEEISSAVMDLCGEIVKQVVYTALSTSQLSVGLSILKQPSTASLTPTWEQWEHTASSVFHAYSDTAKQQFSQDNPAVEEILNVMLMQAEGEYMARVRQFWIEHKRDMEDLESKVREEVEDDGDD